MKLWKFCRGYVKIGIMGEYPERLVNRCLEAGVPLKDTGRRQCGFEARVAVGDIKRLRCAARGTGCRVRILARYGGARLIPWLFRNGAFAAAAALLFITCAVLSTRLWFISVDSVSIPEREVLAIIGEMGAARGKPKSGFTASAIAAALNADKRVANAKVILRGVTLRIEIAGRYPKEERGKETSPASIYAAKDCVIDSVSVYAGRACVTQGQAVRKGELLISGDLSASKPGYFVRAEGELIGRVLYRVSATAPALREEPTPSGRSSKAIAISLFGFELSLDRPYPEFGKEPEKAAFITASPLPIRVEQATLRELIPGAVPDTREGIERRARLMAQEKLNTAVPQGARIVTLRTDCEYGGDGSVTARITVTVLENIGIIGSLHE